MKRKPDFIDFLDASQIYFDLITTCICSLHFILSVTDEQCITSIISSLEYAEKGLEKLLNNYLESIKGGGNNAE